MKIRALRRTLSLASLSAGLALGSTADATTVYTETNSANGNAVQIYASDAAGALSLVGTSNTDGLGTGAGLGNQGALALSADGRLLYAVNAGSDDISTFEVTDSGLRLLDRVASGGSRPISVTVHHRVVFVLNAGGSGNIVGFHAMPDGHLSPIAGSSRPLSSDAAGPAEIAFNPEGDTLIVTEKALNKIAIYAVSHGIPTRPLTRASAGTTPFGFVFDRRGTLLVSEAFGGASGASALSSYELEDDGALETISTSIPTHQTAACWVVLARRGRFAYTTNTGSGTVTGYRVARSGEITRLNPDGVTGFTGGGPTDGASTPDGRLMYVLSPSIGQIVAFRVEADGSLQTIGSAPGAPATATGIVVR